MENKNNGYTDFQSRDPWDVWQYENELINHRLMWLGVMSPLVFGIYAWAAIESPEITVAIAGFGLVSSASIYIGVLAAIVVQLMLYLNRKVSRLGFHPLTTLAGWTPALVVPLLIVFGWAALFLG